MLQVRAKSMFSDVYVISEGREDLTEVNIRWTREAGSFLLDGASYAVGRDGWMSGDFYLESPEGRLAAADKPSAFTRRFKIRAGERELELAAVSPFTRSFELRERGRAVGSVRPVSIWTRSAKADLPEDLPMPTRVFLIWLVKVMWRRGRNSNAAAHR